MDFFINLFKKVYVVSYVDDKDKHYTDVDAIWFWQSYARTIIPKLSGRANANIYITAIWKEQ